MTASEDQIQKWIEEGKSRRAGHLLLVHNSFDVVDYPLFLEPHIDVHQFKKEYQTPFNSIVGVYPLS